jgi:16S rRNA G966 N2-methylase RsmD
MPATRKEKRALVSERLKESPELPDRVIARQLNVAHSFVGAIRRELGLKIRLETSENTYLSHPYLVANPRILDGLSARSLRALKAPGVLDKMAEMKIGPMYAQRLLNRARKNARKNAGFELASEDIILKCDDLRNGLPWIADNSVDVCLVDPPYAAEYVPLYKSIAELGARVLKQHGILLVLTGQSHLDKIIFEMAQIEELRYNWLLALVTLRGGSTLVHKRGVTPYHKPLLMYTKGQYSGDIFSDVAVIASPPDKAREKYHEWEQDLQSFSELLERFSDPGMTVLDCCAGSGTTGVAAVRLGRKFIGCDIDPAAVETARLRIMAALSARG